MQTSLVESLSSELSEQKKIQEALLERLNITLASKQSESCPSDIDAKLAEIYAHIDSSHRCIASIKGALDEVAQQPEGLC